MTGEDIEQGEEDAFEQQSAVAGQLAKTERSFLRLTLWQTVLSVAGVVIAVIALYAALSESAAVRQQTAAAVWPFVQMVIRDYDDGERASFAMSFTNAGVGPARMRDIRIAVNGTAARDWAHMVQLVNGDPSAEVGRNFIAGRVLRPDESVDLISTSHPGLARRFQAAMADQQSALTYCYCSIFDECWLADSRKDLQQPEAVTECPTFAGEAYGNPE